MNYKALSLRSIAILSLVVVLIGCRSTQDVVQEPVELTLEYLKSLDPELLKTMDSDSDGLSDYDEIYVYGTNPLDPDTDGDGLTDYDEVMVHGTDPLNADTDGDGLSDGDEVNKYRTNPLSADTDGDGLNDYDEIYVYGTDPNNPDTDGDGFTDGQEIQMGTDPLDPNDPMVIRQMATINFDFDRSNIDARAAQLLAENVEKLKNAPNYRFRIEAFTDHVGGDQYNLRLSVRRANAVMNFYKDNGIAEDRMTAAGLGKAPVPCAQPDPGAKGCRANRRAESIPVNPYPFSPGPRTAN
jgi:outer membrane protein OmpA-like peptidoglycan-associated protein